MRQAFTLSGKEYRSAEFIVSALIALSAALFAIDLASLCANGRLF